MEEIMINGKEFVILLSERRIQDRLLEIGSILRQDHQGEELVFVVILKGSLFVSADLIRAYGLPCSVEAIRARSYHGMKSSGVVEITMTETKDLGNKTVIIVEDIVETGRTLQAVHHHLLQLSPKKVLTFCLLRKPSAENNPINIDYVGFNINQEFVVGYGLDYDEEGRYLKDIYQLKE